MRKTREAGTFSSARAHSAAGTGCTDGEADKKIPVSDGGTHWALQPPRATRSVHRYRTTDLREQRSRQDVTCRMSRTGSVECLRSRHEPVLAARAGQDLRISRPEASVLTGRFDAVLTAAVLTAAVALPVSGPHLFTKQVLMNWCRLFVHSDKQVPAPVLRTAAGGGQRRSVDAVHRYRSLSVFLIASKSGWSPALSRTSVYCTTPSPSMTKAARLAMRSSFIGVKSPSYFAP